MRTRTRAPRGFTLIELMLVVAIIGILASVAAPEYLNLRHRARGAERPIVADAIARAVMDHYSAKGTASLDGHLPNPTDIPGLAGAPMERVRTDGWAEILNRISVDRKVYYRYSFESIEPVGNAPATLVITAEGDLDGDGVPSVKTWTYERKSGAYTMVSQFPAAGQEDLETYGTF